MGSNQSWGNLCGVAHLVAPLTRLTGPLTFVDFRGDHGRPGSGAHRFRT